MDETGVTIGLFVLTLTLGLTAFLLRRELRRYDKRMARITLLEDQVEYLNEQVKTLQEAWGIKPPKPFPRLRRYSDDSTTEDIA